ncbi:Polyketide synthase modules and related proteins [hydrothermal vent metagenome]|uniref:Polyketide synthase modules and related proteins n=1 Tax=hydrothermal vent metagenome TaxID=652676 RepID=A0A3B1ARY5_9ZZZZ
MDFSSSQYQLDVEKYLSSVLQQVDVIDGLTHVVSLHACNDFFSESLSHLIHTQLPNISLVDIVLYSPRAENSNTDKLTSIKFPENSKCSFFRAESCQSECINLLLAEAGVGKVDSALFILSLPEENHGEQVKRLNELKACIGRHGLLLVTESIEPDKLMLDTASIGFFPQTSHTEKSSLSYLCLNWLEKRDYIIRLPQADDYSELVRLDKDCWSEGRRTSPADIKYRISAYPQGQCVLEVDGNIVGSIYSQRISDLGLLKGRLSSNVLALHQPDTAIAQLIAVNIQPDKQYLGYGDQLLEFMLQYCTANHKIERVAAVSLCKNYPLHQSIPIEHYIKERDSDGLLLDPILRFHEYHGAKITGLIAGYRPADLDNKGNGVLVEYDLANRKPYSINKANGSMASANGHVFISDKDFPAVVEALITSMLGPQRQHAYSIDCSLMDMGFDSLDLMKLKAQLSERTGITLDSTFFFENSTTEAIINALQTNNFSKNNATDLTWQRDKIPQQVDKVFIEEPHKDVQTEAIAIIGMGCRFPGNVNSAEELWSMLENAEDGVGDIPVSRWDSGLYNSENLSARISSTQGGTLRDIEQFAAAFFNISPREANLLDPQQRILLEVSYQAMEDAGIASTAYKDKEVGIYTGMFSHDYELLQVKQNDNTQFEPYYATGNSNAVAAGRLAYAFGFQGPTITVDTACSSSLVAVHLACQSLRQSECELALAGGVNLILSPELSFAFSQAGMLSPDGRCKTFDKDANGYVRSEGCGVVVLKRLSQAINDNDNIVAVIRGSAINQDGASNGLTAPNPVAQEAVIRRALAQAKLKPIDISYVEAHGTGTHLGDPIEVSALDNVYGENRSNDNPLVLGSIKTNIGHTEAAAGIAGLIKTALSLQHQFIPAHLHFKTVNPALDLNAIPAEIPVVGRYWEKSAEKSLRYAAVSSFGFSGTNAHVVLQESHEASVQTDALHREYYLLPVSAKTKTACDSLVKQYASYFDSNPQGGLGDVWGDACYTASVGRNHFLNRACVIASNASDASKQFKLLKNAKQHVDIYTNTPKNNNDLNIAFLFTGQGAQLMGMGRKLYETQTEFRQVLDECEDLLRPHLDKLLLDVIFNDDDLLHQTRYTQPALFAVEYALARLWMSWGITPTVVLGHSVGEYVAACIAGVMSLADACALISKRGQLMQALPNNGAMAAVFTTQEMVNEKITPYGTRVSIAALNGPEHTVISGEADSIDTLCAEFEQQGIQVYRLQVSHAFHSELMQPMLKEFKAFAGTIKFKMPGINCVSNLTGQLVQDEIMAADYWVEHIISPVQFLSSMQTLESFGTEFYLEIGPQPVLLGMGKRCVQSKNAMWLSSLEQGVPNQHTMLRSLANFYMSGAEINWDRLYNKKEFKKTNLPFYSFERQPYWFSSAAAEIPIVQRVAVKSFGNNHPLLGSRISLPTKEWQYQSSLSRSSLRYLDGHCVFQQAILPAAAFIEIAFAAALDVDSGCGWTIQNSEFNQALCLLKDKEQLLHTIVTPVNAIANANKRTTDTFYFSIYSCNTTVPVSDNEWQPHCHGELLKVEKDTTLLIDIADIRCRCINEVEAKSFYQALAQRQYGYGDAFQAITKLYVGDNEVLAKIESHSLNENLNYYIHPVILDACFQSALILSVDATLVPVSVESATLLPLTDNEVWAYVEVIEEEKNKTLSINLKIIGLDGCVVADIKGLRFMATQRAMLLHASDSFMDNALYQVRWKQQALSTGTVLSATPAELQRYLTAYEQAEPSLLQLELSATIVKELELLCNAYVVTALEQLGQDMSVGASFTSADIALGSSRGQSCITGHHYQQLEHLLLTLVDAGVLSQKNEKWTVKNQCNKATAAQQFTELLKRYPVAEPELVFIERCGTQLSAALKNKCDVLQLLFPEGDTEGAAKFYQQSLTFKGMNRLVAESVMKIAEDFPKDKPLRILEIGAGTGGITTHILSCLKNRKAEYVFTDVSRLFLSKASERFSEYGFIRYSLLDIESSPLEQGFLENEFDVVVAANVLHATSDLSITLNNAKKLLAPKGMLVLLEGTAPSRWIDLIFGLTEGWWRFTDKDLRPSHPLLSDEKWMRCLNALGFDSMVTICPDKKGNQMLFKQSVIIAQNKTVEPIVTKPLAAKHWLLFSDASGKAENLAKQLELNGDRASLVYAGAAYKKKSNTQFTIRSNHLIDYEQLLKDTGSTNAVLCGVVYFWTLKLNSVEQALSMGVGGLANPGYASVLNLVKLLVNADLDTTPKLFLTTQQAQSISPNDLSTGLAQSHVWGMGKVISLEHPELNCKLIDIYKDNEQSLSCVDALYKEVVSGSNEDQVAIREDGRYVARLESYTALNFPANSAADDTLLVDLNTSQSCQLKINERGTLDQLQLQSVSRIKPEENEIEIRVHAAGLNFRDVLNALGHYPGDPGALGDECAGEVVAVGNKVKNISVGHRVMSMAAGSLGEYITVNSDLAAVIPDDMHYQQAATIPVVFLTVHYALRILAGIKKGDRVLIHAATGGVGQSAIQIAQQAGAEVFATASPKKWGVLKVLGVKHIMNSRDLDFVEQIKELTNGEGLDIALNSLAGDFIEKTLSVLKPDGCFLEIGKSGIWSEEKIHKLRPKTQYHIIDMLEIRRKEPELVQSMLSDLIKEFSCSVLKPLPHVSFPLAKSTDAFRYMQQARHTGKIVIDITNKAEKNISKPVVQHDATYLITGGLGGLGLLLANWFVSQGAKRIVLMSRCAANETAQLQVQSMIDKGVDVVVEQADVRDLLAVKQIIDTNIQHALPLKGVIHAVGVLDDGALVQQTPERFEFVMAPKIEGAWHLHKMTQHTTLDFFILFSSTASLLGTPGQANHAAANAFLDQLSHYRRCQDLPASCINWGAWSDIGAAARYDVGDQWAERGISSIKPEQGMQAFQKLFDEAPVQAGVAPVLWDKYMMHFPAESKPAFYDDVAVAVVMDVALDNDSSSEAVNIAPVDIKQDIHNGEHSSLVNYLHEQVSRVLHFDKETILNPDQSLNEYGLDSLTGIELRNRINKDFGIKLSLEQFFNKASLTRWSVSISEQIMLDKVSTSAEPTVNAATEDYEEMTL